MDHPVAYDMVLEHMLHVQTGYMTHGAIPGPGMQEDRRHHYVIVNTSRSNAEGNHWGMALWDGTSCPEAITFVDPYENPWIMRIPGDLRMLVEVLGEWACGPRR